ncbi:3' exoribonuclease family protein, putative [Cryptosporidium muris RN66]|uniref:3' exoribonuclease family protein, putative n=1 Tax=Cryptosporidium muris (strain RN66) TaxID=441375 RepID=B6ACQ4_CRYMR|nr:3' exoribonuclease family protein, putative [Cryptosporidium muris RN66]EEA05908.1 3' exoribonuclease family protein, putative [Cryptosporidium muris RN66]|eukprot:XP_002140257.1 3' exoribonuclease family protein [Cryptosporidium muris RN66]
MEIRLDGRQYLELRPINIRIGVFHGLSGSSDFSMGLSRATAVAWQPEETNNIRGKSYLDVIIRPNSGSTGDTEKLLELYCTRVLEDIIDFKQIPRCIVSVAIQVISQDGPIFPICFNAAVLALLDAGIPMTTTPLAISIAEACTYQLNDLSKHIIIDPNGEEIDKCISCSHYIVSSRSNQIIACLIAKGTGITYNDKIYDFDSISIAIAGTKVLCNYIRNYLQKTLLDNVGKSYDNNIS